MLLTALSWSDADYVCLFSFRCGGLALLNGSSFMINGSALSFSSGIFAVIFSSPLRVAVASPVPLLVTTHPLRTSRSDETRTRSARRLVPVAPLSRLFPYPDFSDERSPSTPPTCEA
ncbi:unnamed protein product [Brassica napus]|uniref:(rape) hypothetical protein n=1 Tax=Brassica napus TaxID=3708 RepID=A0A816QBP9_BRANA|nr:unnamed protein product [Brassica napus]